MALDREYKIGARSRRCQACSREFGVGDEYLSTVVETAEEDRLARQDFCPGCWKPDAQPYFSFWKTRVAEPELADRKGPQLVDLARLMQLFEHLAESPDEQAQRFRYVLALVLMRKRRLRIVDSRRVRGKGDVLTLRETGSERRHVVEAPGISDDEIRSVADRLREILDMPEKWDQVSTVEAEAPPAGAAAPAAAAGGPDGLGVAAEDGSRDKDSDEDNPKEEDAELKHREDEFENDEDEEFEKEEEKEDEDEDEDEDDEDDDEDEDDDKSDDDEDADEDRDA